MKRLIDIIISSIILIGFVPIGIIIIILLSITGEGEIFYRQSRVGKDGKTIRLFKFTTMLKNSPNLGAGDITLKNDPRVLPFGKFLRKTKLNEFPQFINVLIGEMSIVGPRPLVINQYKMIPEKLLNKIRQLKPGITGIGSIIFRDEEFFLDKVKDRAQLYYEKEIVPYKSTLECWYFENKSTLCDLIIIILTVIAVILPKNKIHNFFFPNLPRHPVFNPN